MENNIDQAIKKRQSILRHLDELSYALEPLYRIDFEKLKDLKKILRDLENEFSQFEVLAGRFSPNIRAMAKRDQKVELVGLLPLMLMSKELFPTHRSLLTFSSDALHIKLKNLSRPSRTRIIGEILSEVAKIPAKDLDSVLDKLQATIRNKQVYAKPDFFTEWDSAIGRMRSEYGK